MFNGLNSSTDIVDLELAKSLVPAKTQWFAEVSVAESGLGTGQGCFIRIGVPEGFLLCIAGGRVLPELPEEDKIHNFAVNFGPGIYIVPESYKNPTCEWYMNHHCSSNLKVLSGTHFFARRNLLAGEELFIDYGIQLAGRINGVFHCLCGSTSCRRTIRGDDYLDRTFSLSRFSEFSPLIQREILNHAL